MGETERKPTYSHGQKTLGGPICSARNKQMVSVKPSECWDPV